MKLIRAARALISTGSAIGPRVDPDRLNELIRAVDGYLHPTQGGSLAPVACRSCGASILFIRTSGGKKTPVDARPMSGYDITGHLVTIRLSHFATCPFADQHRKSS